MALSALTRLLQDEVTETIEALAAALRSVSPHMAEMVHAQILEDCTVLCESLQAYTQEPPATRQGQQLFTAYLGHRRRAGFSDHELQAVVAEAGAMLRNTLETSCPMPDRRLATRQLEQGLQALESLISATSGTVAQNA